MRGGHAAQQRSGHSWRLVLRSCYRPTRSPESKFWITPLWMECLRRGIFSGSALPRAANAFLLCTKNALK